MRRETRNEEKAVLHSRREVLTRSAEWNWRSDVGPEWKSGGPDGIAAEVVNASENQIDFLMPDVHGDVTVTVKNEVASDEAVVPVM